MKVLYWIQAIVRRVSHIFLGRLLTIFPYRPDTVMTEEFFDFRFLKRFQFYLPLHASNQKIGGHHSLYVWASWNLRDSPVAGIAFSSIFEVLDAILESLISQTFTWQNLMHYYLTYYLCFQYSLSVQIHFIWPDNDSIANKRHLFNYCTWQFSSIQISNISA